MADLSWINPDILARKEEFKTSFQERGILSLDNFLKEEKANFFYDWFTKEHPEDWWYTASLGPEGHGDDAYARAKITRRGSPKELEETDGEILDACQSVAHQKFSYIFDRTMQNHVDNCPCPQCSIINWLETDCSELMLELTGYTKDQLRLTSTFVNRYRAGHFLAPHTDTPNGRLGQIYSLVKDWKPQYGGNLYYLEHGDEIKEVVKPQFNRLQIFDTHLLPAHFVSHLSPSCPIPRISVTGWYSKAAAEIEKAKEEAYKELANEE